MSFFVLVLPMHDTLLIDWLTCVQNILQPSFVGPFDVVSFVYNSRAIINFNFNFNDVDLRAPKS